MTISINTTYSGAAVDLLERPSSDVKLKELLEEVLEEKNVSGENLRWLDDQTIEVSGLAPMALHTFILKAEELGKDVTYHKKTIIEIK